MIVNRTSTSLALGSSLSPSRFGQTVTLSAELSGFAPTGAIEFLADDAVIGTAALVGSGDVVSASLVTSTLSVGNPVLKARYAGDGNNAASEFTLFTQQVLPAATRLNLVSDANPGTTGPRLISVSLQVEAPGGGVPTGSVNLSSGSSNCVATLSGGTGSCALQFNTKGNKTVNSTFVPNNANYLSSTSSLSIVIADSSSISDLRVRIGNGQEIITAGSALNYQVTVDNLGPDAAVGRVQVPISASLIGASFQCLRAGPAQCGPVSGTGSIDTEVSLGAGGVLVYTITASAPVNPEAPITQSASIGVLAPNSDPVSANNTATDTDPMGLFLNGFEDVNPNE